MVRPCGTPCVRMTPWQFMKTMNITFPRDFDCLSFLWRWGVGCFPDTVSSLPVQINATMFRLLSQSLTLLHLFKKSFEATTRRSISSSVNSRVTHRLHTGLNSSDNVLCTVDLLSPVLSAISRTVWRRSVSITSFTCFSIESLFFFGRPLFSPMFPVHPLVKRLCHL